MVVDRRHDHSFRIPRPDLSGKFGLPNACNDCHTDKPAGWAATAVDRWHGPNRKGFQTYAEAFHAARTDRSDAAALLAVVASNRSAPSIARATALTELASQPAAANVALVRAGLSDPDPMVRLGALDLLELAPTAQISQLALPLLTDESRGVRIRAASLLAGVAPASLSSIRPQSPRARRRRIRRSPTSRCRSARGKERAWQLSGAARVPRRAETKYKAAQRLSPQFVPAAVNLADLYRGLGRDGDGEATLRAALVVSPQDAGLHHTLGLALVRLQRNDEALIELRRAAEIEPERTRYAYVYAVALHSAAA